MTLLTLAVVASAVPARATTAYGLTLDGRLYQINDATGAVSLDHDIGTKSYAGLATSSSQFWTVEDNLHLMRFTPTGTVILQRDLPFIGAGHLEDIAFEGSGVGWAIVDTGDSTEFWTFGKSSGQTLKFTVPSNSISAIDFGSTGSLYCWVNSANPSITGLNVVDKLTGEVTKIDPGTGVMNCLGMGVKGGTGGYGPYCAAFNDVAVGNMFDDSGVVLTTPNHGIVAVDYFDIQGISIPATVVSVGLGTVTQNNAGCLDDLDNDPLRICKAFVPNVSSPIIRVEVNFHVGTGATFLGAAEATRMASAGTFILKSETLDPATSAYVSLYTRQLSLSKTNFAVSVPLTAIDGSANVRMRLSITRTGFAATAVPCAEFDQLAITKT